MEKLEFKHKEKVDAITKATKLIEICSLQNYKPEELTRITARIDNVKRGYVKGELTKKEKKVLKAISQYDISIRQARDWFKALCLRPGLKEKVKQGRLPIKVAIKLWNENKLNDLKEYVISDVQITFGIFKRVKEVGLL